MPPGDTVEERILANVVTTLAAIATGTDFYTTVSRVHRMEGNVLDLPERPAVVVLHDDTGQKYGSIDQVECRLKLTLSLVMNREPSSWSQDIARFVTDVVKALRTDCGRGTASGSSNAFDTYIVGHRVANESDGFPLAIAEVDVEIQFRHLLSDPTVAI